MWMGFISIPVVATLYILTNIAFFAVLSYQEILKTKAVGLVSLVATANVFSSSTFHPSILKAFGNVALGKSGVVIFSIIGLILTIGGAHANIFESSRQVGMNQI